MSSMRPRGKSCNTRTSWTQLRHDASLTLEKETRVLSTPDGRHLVWRTLRASWLRTLARKTQTSGRWQACFQVHYQSRRGRLVALTPCYTARHVADLLSLLKHPEEGRHGADVQRVRGDDHDVVQDPSQLSVQNCKHNRLEGISLINYLRNKVINTLNVSRVSIDRIVAQFVCEHIKRAPLIHWARGGAWMFSSFSTARE